MSMSTYAKNKCLNAIFKGTTWTGESGPYLSYHTADPGLTGASECTGGSYSRELTGFGTVAAGAVANNTVEATTMPAQTATYGGWWNAASSGDFLWGWPLDAPVTFALDDIADLASGDADIVL